MEAVVLVNTVVVLKASSWWIGILKNKEVRNSKFEIRIVSRKRYLFVLDPVWVEAVKIPLDSDNHLLQAAVTAAAASAMALLSWLVTDWLLPRRLPCLWYSSRTIILSRSDDPVGTPLNLCLLGGALRIVLEAPAGIGDSVGVDEGLEGGGVVPVKYANGRHD